MCSACMTIRPWWSNSAVEASRRSLMLAEWALRTSTTPISSHAARRAPSMTWSVTGSMSAIAYALDHQRPVFRGAAAPAGRHDQRGLGQFDDRRALYLARRAPVHRRVVLLAVEVRPARALVGV